MKRLLIVPILALMASAFGSAAQAHHPGAQSPDLEPSEDYCYIEFHAHGSCTVTDSEPGLGEALTSHIMGAPTADGWHVDVTLSLINNDTATLEKTTRKVVTIPYIADWLGIGAPLPNPPGDGNFTNKTGPMTSATCLAEVASGNGGILHCYLGQGASILPPSVPSPV